MGNKNFEEVNKHGENQQKLHQKWNSGKINFSMLYGFLIIQLTALFDNIWVCQN